MVASAEKSGLSPVQQARQSFIETVSWILVLLLLMLIVVSVAYGAITDNHKSKELQGHCQTNGGIWLSNPKLCVWSKVERP